MSTFSQFSNFTSFQSFLEQSLSNSISILHVNIRSLRKNWNEFQVLVQTIGDAVDVFVLTEINVPRDMLQQFSLLGYHGSFYTRDHSGGGGIVVYVKDVWPTSS